MKRRGPDLLPRQNRPEPAAHRRPDRHLRVIVCGSIRAAPKLYSACYVLSGENFFLLKICRAPLTERGRWRKLRSGGGTRLHPSVAV